MVVVLTAGCGCHSQFVTCWRKPVGSPGCKALAGSGCGSAAWGLHGSFPTRWHQHFSLTRKSVIRCSVAAPSPAFPPTPVAGDGAWDFRWAAILRAFFLAFISLQQEEMKLQHCNWDVVWSWVQTAVYIVSFVFQGPLKKDRTAKEETA